MLGFRNILIIGFIVLLTSCTNEKHADEALNALGFTEIRYTGYDLFACGQDDFYSTGFVAKNIKGDIVSGTVCSAFIFKKSTVRF